MKNSGIYTITNLINSKIYIGSSKNLKRRISAHKWLLSNNIHNNKHLQFSVNKYSIENFEFNVLENCEVENLILREQFYIDLLKPQYNKALVLLNKGYVWTDEMKKKQSEKCKGRLFSKETREKLRLSSKNRVRTAEDCLSISNAKKGKRLHQNSLDASRLSIIKSIIQYDKNMNKIKTFESIIDASRELNINSGNIQSVCSGKRASAGGFVFKYNSYEYS